MPHGNTGVPKTAQHKAALSVALRNNRNAATPRSEETKAKMRKPKSESHKANMRKPKSAEHRANMAIAAKARWARQRKDAQ